MTSCDPPLQVPLPVLETLDDPYPASTVPPLPFRVRRAPRQQVGENRPPRTGLSPTPFPCRSLEGPLLEQVEQRGSWRARIRSTTRRRGQQSDAQSFARSDLRFATERLSSARPEGPRCGPAGHRTPHTHHRPLVPTTRQTGWLPRDRSKLSPRLNRRRIRKITASAACSVHK